MQHSEHLDKLAYALVLANAEVRNLPMTGKNPHFNSSFITLEDLTDHVRAVYGVHELALVQFPISDGDRIGVETVVVHSSGQWISESFTMHLPKNDPQQAGGGLTYARRYGIAAVTGIAGDTDDDGNAATAAVHKSAPAPRASGGVKLETPTEEVLEKKRRQFFAAARAAGVDNTVAKETLKERWDLMHFDEASMEQLQGAIDALDRKAKGA